MNIGAAAHPTQQRTALVPFGKFRGTPLAQIPDDYLLWLSTLDDLRNPLLRDVLHEMARRMMERDRQPTTSETEPA
jgi:hypothetical protein